MAIQFRCTGCGQAIEVDDVYADRPVACPFCQATVQAPKVSQLDAGVPTASPAQPQFSAIGGAGLESLGMQRVSPSAKPDPAWLCSLGMVCALGIPLIAGLITWMVIAQTGMGAKMQALQSQKADGNAQMALYQEEARKWTESHPLLNGTMSISIVVLSIVGLSASIAGLMRARTRRWQAIVGLMMTIPCVGCMAIGVVFTLVRGATGS